LLYYFSFIFIIILCLSSFVNKRIHSINVSSAADRSVRKKTMT